MNTNVINIRLEKKRISCSRKPCKRIILERVSSGRLEHYVLNQLREDPGFVPELDFVMELDGKMIGQNMFMEGSDQIR